MNKLTDEILNKYLDNELDQASSKMVRDMLNNSEEGRKRLAALQTVDTGLRNITIDSVPPDFTSNLMKKISKKSRAKKEQRVFIFSVSSIFMIIALGIIGYMMALIFSAPPSAAGTVTGTQETLTLLENIIRPIKNFLGNANISVIGSIFSLGLLISVYFILDLVKHTKQNLSRQH
jgi:anti-sigma factor RsiW